MMSDQAKGGRKVTGRTVLFAMIAFFAVVAGVNAVMIRAATSTFGGVETESAYRVGLAFNHEIAEAAAQDARHWTVDGDLHRMAAGQAELIMHVRDAAGQPLPGLALTARLAHPADARRDRTIEIVGAGVGAFKGYIDADPGQWDLYIEASRDGEPVFRSKSRLTLR